MQVADLDSIREAASYISSKAPGVEPQVAVILGSGLSEAAPKLKSETSLPYAQIPSFPTATVLGHKGELVLGEFERVGVAVLKGRFHYYEGHSMAAVVFPLRVLKTLGLRTLIITAAVGSMRKDIKPGHIAVLKDHLNLMGVNPLRGFHLPDFGEMFPDLTDAYSPALRKAALKACRSLKIKAGEAVYAAASGPSYETPSEVRAFRGLGGDVVGMSVVPEAITARQMGVEVLALSWVSNMAAGMTHQRLTHADVLALGQRVSGDLRRLLSAVLSGLGGNG